MLYPKRLLCFVAVSVLAATVAHAQQVAPLRVNPNALLAIDQNRTTVVDRIVSNWGDALVQSGAGVTPDQLREILNGLRADHLLAASLAGTSIGLRDVVANALTATAPVKPSLLQTKALGDTSDDLVYTPIVPCRILDTRKGTVPPYNSPMVGGSAFPVAANLSDFAPQGGSATNCNLPASFQAVVVTFTVLNPNFDAYLAASNSSNFATLIQSVVMDFSANKGLANTATVPVDGTEKFYLGLPAQVTTNVIADVAGYFKPAMNTATGAFEVAVNGNLALQIQPDATSPIIIAGSNANTVTAGASGAVIGGGGVQGNTVLGWDCAGTCANRVTDAFGTVGGGAGNQAGDNAGTVVDSRFATVGGGFDNIARALASIVGGGYQNTAYNLASTIAGGHSNIAVGIFSTVGGGQAHTASGDYSTIAGGSQNVASGYVSTVGGGFPNTAGGNYSTVAGGNMNTASGDYSTVGGGQDNGASGNGSTVAGGIENGTQGAITSTVGGGSQNIASGVSSTVAGGWQNVASGDFSTVAGGYSNHASGHDSTVAGGQYNTASGYWSFAAGNGAHTQTPDAATTHDGVFLWADSYAGPVSRAFNSVAPNEFAARATGGVRFVTAVDGTGAPTWTCAASNGNSWACSSDRNLKENFKRVDVETVLQRLAELPLYFWNAKGTDPNVRHMGPTAQDFMAAFALGNSDKMIGMQDADGVALAAIQGLHQMMQQKDREIVQLRRKLQAIEAKLGM